jgi:putative membrane-bound dehydrogenase-like protein
MKSSRWRSPINKGYFLFAVLIGFISCKNQNTNGDPSLYFAKAEDFADSSNVAVNLNEEFELKLWAPGPLLANAVAISFDNQGAAYVTETQRRKSSDIDIRAHRDWMTDDLALQSLDDTREFHRHKLSREQSDQNEWLEDFNQDGFHDWQDLTVQSEQVRKIWDSDGDGRADIAALYAKDINDMITGVAAGVLYHNDHVYLTAAPDLYRFTDKDQDGDADHREVISHGFGIHIAYAGHDMSGLVMGPDGKIYWSVGDIGVNTTSKEGVKFFYPNQGAVMRCNPDGTDFEVYAHGLRNPQELAFDAYGNLISVDNDGDHAGEHERFVHILEGSDSGWRINWQFGKYNDPNEEYKVWMDEKLHVPHFPGQAAYLLPPLALAPDGPAGLVYQPGSALNDQWNNFFFGSYFKGSAAQSKIQAFRLEPKGASFKVAETKDILSGIVSTGLAFGPDGGLYANDWLEGYAKKPAGRIWKLDVKQKDHELRTQTRELLAGGFEDKTSDELEQLLTFVDMRVRLAAQFELVRRDQSEVFLNVLNQQSHELAQIHAVWGLGQLAREHRQIGAQLMPFLSSENEEVRTQTAKVLGDARIVEAVNGLLVLLKDTSPRVVYYASEALGKIGDPQAFKPLTALVMATGDTDPHLRHGLIYALSRLNMEPQLIALSSHSSMQLRLAAVVALRRLRSPGLKEFLQDLDTLVLMEAARAINDDLSVPEALPALAEALITQPVNNEVFVRRAINANLRLADAASAVRLTKYANNAKAPMAMRVDALWALGYWNNPPVLDRVDGRYRALSAGNLEDAQQAFSSIVKDLLASKQVRLKASAIEAAGRLKYQYIEQQLVDFCRQKNQPLEIRRAALQSLAKLESRSLQDLLYVILEDTSVELRTDAQSLLGVLDLSPEVVVELLGQILDKSTIPEKQQALISLAGVDHPDAIDILGRWLDLFIADKLEPHIQLDLLEAVEKISSSELDEKLAVYEKNRNSQSPVIRYKETLFGGDATEGRRIFMENNSAQCIRCHKIETFGGEVGPDLTNAATVLDRESLLEAMVAPSVRLAPGYGTVNVQLKDGSKLVGVLENDHADTIVLKTSDDSSTVVPPQDIKTKTYVPSSMPSMEGVLTRREIRDLVAFLVTLK